jgi:hypothetical protein
VVNGLADFSPDDTVWVLGQAAFAIVGSVVAARRPELPIGWLFCAAGLLGLVGGIAARAGVHALADTSGSTDGGTAAWLSAALSYPNIALMVLGALLTALVTAVYLTIVVGVGTLVGSRGNQDLFLSIVATAVIAVAFQPARERSRRLANHLVYGERASPYEVLSQFSRGMAGASTDDSLLHVARLVVEATGAEQVTVWLRLGEPLQPQARWPQTGPPPEPFALDGHRPGAALAGMPHGSRSFPVTHEDELLGALTVTSPPESRSPRPARS